jgi:predicted transcriptional regulator YdeE
MDYRLVERPAFTVAGVSLRTSNRRPRRLPRP